MSITYAGYVGLMWAVFAASTLTQSLSIAVGVVLILVGLSTLMIRFASVVEGIVRRVIRKMQVDGDLPTNLEREEILQAVVTLVEYNQENTVGSS